MQIPYVQEYRLSYEYLQEGSLWLLHGNNRYKNTLYGGGTVLQIINQVICSNDFLEFLYYNGNALNLSSSSSSAGTFIKKIDSC